MSLLTVILFFGGWSGGTPLINAATFTLKGLVFCFFFVLVRATLPRYRYDQLMDIGWKIFLPITTGFLFHVIGIITAFGLLPVTYEIA
jgi:NADH-quinone oxidoreductase subunit H